ncbi:serpin family protein [Streptomyces sp. MST-110588]|uniref:serpin family protein n=1 Tax=Streptomyces sp. MST-110588 TaxID=2833628 RepID=UPI001F5CD29C|nr:serpin family protein [Streptomyces sp. MST-110588]
MTARWVRDIKGERGTVLTAAGVWPLLALLAGPAGGAAREELQGALGIGADGAVAAGRELLESLRAQPGIDAAVGVWSRRDLPLRPLWRMALPVGAHEVFSGEREGDQRALDAWAARNTDGLIERMPVVVDDDTRMLLASALLVRTTWREPFDETFLEAAAGPWAGQTAAGLVRYQDLGEELAVLHTPDGPVTSLRVDGDNGIDVRLVLGPEGCAPGAVLAAGVADVEGVAERTPGQALPDGPYAPGVTVRTVPSWSTTPRLATCVPSFTVSAEHDLLERAELFGLKTAQDERTGHFPGISDEPLAVSQARQSATATFGPLGFRAAAVTAIPATAGAAPMEPPYQAKIHQVVFDRPFGFLAVHRASGLVLAAGWVAEPEVRVGMW